MRPTFLVVLALAIPACTRPDRSFDGGPDTAASDTAASDTAASDTAAGDTSLLDASADGAVPAMDASMDARPTDDAAIDAGAPVDAPADARLDAPPDAGPCTGPASCDDGNPCTDDACTLGLCGHTSTASGTECGPGDPTVCEVETCNGSGLCVTRAMCRAPRLECCGDGTCCTIDDRR
jgi:hypothetical protein